MSSTEVPCQCTKDTLKYDSMILNAWYQVHLENLCNNNNDNISSITHINMQPSLPAIGVAGDPFLSTHFSASIQSLFPCRNLEPSNIGVTEDHLLRSSFSTCMCGLSPFITTRPSVLAPSQIPSTVSSHTFNNSYNQQQQQQQQQYQPQQQQNQYQIQQSKKNIISADQETLVASSQSHTPHMVPYQKRHVKPTKRMSLPNFPLASGISNIEHHSWKFINFNPSTFHKWDHKKSSDTITTAAAKASVISTMATTPATPAIPTMATTATAPTTG
ncbi:hypothetical protein J3Q64DRAFT_1866469 [Phycomyces blakesleeanus]|uniref:Homeodomain-like DNA binding domain-containing transcription factor n=1 Tax=Phycomyces blakesleeanus TaxID=4837 RepID=A0ABR3AS64_PHYBL